MDKIPKINRRVTVFAILLSLISIGVLVVGFIIVSSDKVVMLQSISNLYNKTNELFEEDLALLDRISSSSDISVNIKNTLTVGEDKYSINANYIESFGNKKNSLDLEFSSKEKTPILLKFLLDNNDLYANINDNPNTYKTSFKYIHYLRTLSSNDYDKLLSLVKEAFDDSISGKDIRKEKVTINYNGKDKKVNKLTYVINTSELKEISNKLIDSIRKDKELYSNICKVLETSKDNLDKHLDNYLDELNKDSNKDFYSYSTYYYGFNKIVRYELYSYVDDISLVYKTEKNHNTITLSQKDNSFFEIITSKNSSGKYKFSGKVIALDSISKNNNEYDFSDSKYYDIKGTYKDENLTLDIIDLNNRYEITTKRIPSTIDALFKYGVKINVYDILSNGEEKIDFKLKSDIEISFDKKVDTIVKDSINYDELSEEEKNNINKSILNEDLDKLFKEFGIKLFENVEE